MRVFFFTYIPEMQMGLMHRYSQYFLPDIRQLYSSYSLNNMALNYSKYRLLDELREKMMVGSKIALKEMLLVEMKEFQME